MFNPAQTKWAASVASAFENGRILRFFQTTAQLTAKQNRA